MASRTTMRSPLPLSTVIDPLAFRIGTLNEKAVGGSIVGDPSLLNSTRWTSEFVGLGPYRVERWEEGSQIDLVRFDGYWLGRPSLDRVVVRQIPDANTMTAPGARTDPGGKT